MLEVPLSVCRELGIVSTGADGVGVTITNDEEEEDAHDDKVEQGRGRGMAGHKHISSRPRGSLAFASVHVCPLVRQPEAARRSLLKNGFERSEAELWLISQMLGVRLQQAQLVRRWRQAQSSGRAGHNSSGAQLSSISSSRGDAGATDFFTDLPRIARRAIAFQGVESFQHGRGQDSHVR